MAYEELVIPAIQRKDLKGFAHRFRTFTSKEERDRTFNFMTCNQNPDAAANLSPVTLKIIVQTDEVNQMTLDLDS